MDDHKILQRVSSVFGMVWYSVSQVLVLYRAVPRNHYCSVAGYQHPSSQRCGVCLLQQANFTQEGVQS